jgi:cellulose synthase/poly-beta-1,6-N-acetylglucosamine synthase-like glycosyltransferase/peptidoglycan/xylan/chitin deacetylase (PgdA/CDA1 family)
VLTFDDGPDPVFTPKILDILAHEKVKASFFIIGQSAQANGGIVKRIVAEGHDIGNHSYTHPNLGEVPARMTDLELNATQRLIESLTGRSTRLFRAPYFGDAEPTTPDEVEPAERAARLGYLSIGLRVDPDDWALPGADAIVRRTMDALLSTNPDVQGQIILLHDGGGDRRQTIEALPRLIASIKAKGIKIVPVSELAGLTREQAMPPLDSEHRFFDRTDTVVFLALGLGGWFVRVLFLLGIGLGIARLLFIGSLAAFHRIVTRNEPRMPDPAPFVSILIPAFNEVKVIVRTVEALLASRSASFEVLIVDDGSQDGTAEHARERFENDPRVRVFSRPNGGKAAALNFGLQQAKGDIVVALDADTLFTPDTVPNLVRHFSDPRVGAVAGNAKVGNRINLVTRWQALEYITAQNLDRRAFTVLNAISVVPGSVGAWKKDLVLAVGGFPSDTLAEDQDLTLQLRRQGHRIAFAEDAIAWTEAPDTLRGLAKQRFRWSFGTLQCLWKHRGALFHPSAGGLGMVALPNNWIFQVFFPLVSPVVDLMLVFSVISAILERLEHPAEQSITNLGPVLFYYALFLAVDWLASAFAFLLERHERWSLLWGLFLQRFAYRQVMYGVMVRSVAAALSGGLVGWGKLELKATAAVGR